VKKRCWAAVAIAVCMSILPVVGCGGGQAVVSIGDASITRETVSHWMGVLVAGDYRSELMKVAPSGLVSDPPAYGKCVRAATRVVATRAPQATEKLCRELYSAVKRQAVEFLIDATWHKAEAKEHGETVTATELSSAVAALRQREYPRPGAFEKFLRERHLSVADEKFLLERNLFSQKLLARVLRAHRDAGPTEYAQLAANYTTKWRSRTTCQRGYITDQCKDFKASDSGGAAPNSVLSQMAQEQVEPKA
jgi:hypothetical protein